MDNWSQVQHKLVDVETASTIAESWVKDDKKVVFTNGCFDILHRGHVSYLAKAANEGDFLIVAINTDKSIKMLNKGNDRPVNDEESRALLIASLFFVDLVVLFDDETPLETINKIKPNILIKGADYDSNETNKAGKKYIVGSEEVRKNNGKVKVIELEDGFSTTRIIEKIKGTSK